MKAVLFNLVLCVLYVSVYSWIGIISYSKLDSDHGGYCYTDQHKIGALKENEEKRIEGLCAIAKCQENKDIHLSGCAPVGIRPPCYLAPGNLSKPFPECCYEIKCPGKTEDNNKQNSL